MDEYQVRLECLIQAVKTSSVGAASSDEIVDRAKKFYEFVSPKLDTVNPNRIPY